MSFLNRFKDFWYIWSRHVLPVAYWIAYKPRGLGFRLQRWWENTTVACSFHGWVLQIKHKLVNFKITTGFGSEQSACYCGGANGSLQYLESIPLQIAKRGGIDLPVWNSLVGRRFLSLDSLVEPETGILFNQRYSAIISSPIGSMYGIYHTWILWVLNNSNHHLDQTRQGFDLLQTDEAEERRERWRLGVSFLKWGMGWNREDCVSKTEFFHALTLRGSMHQHSRDLFCRCWFTFGAASFARNPFHKLPQSESISLETYAFLPTSCIRKCATAAAGWC